MAFQKVQGLPVNGQVDGVTAAALERATRPAPRATTGDVVEIDKTRQVVLVAVQRDEEVIVPRGPVELRSGDHVTLFAAPGAEQVARDLLGAPEVPPEQLADVGPVDPPAIPGSP